MSSFSIQLYPCFKFHFPLFLLRLNWGPVDWCTTFSPHGLSRVGVRENGFFDLGTSPCLSISICLLFSPLIFGLSYRYDLTLFECNSFNSVVKLDFVGRVSTHRFFPAWWRVGVLLLTKWLCFLFFFFLIIAIIVIKTVKLGRI